MKKPVIGKENAPDGPEVVSEEDQGQEKENADPDHHVKENAGETLDEYTCMMMNYAKFYFISTVLTKSCWHHLVPAVMFSWKTMCPYLSKHMKIENFKAHIWWVIHWICPPMSDQPFLMFFSSHCEEKNMRNGCSHKAIVCFWLQPFKGPQEVICPQKALQILGCPPSRFWTHHTHAV